MNHTSTDYAPWYVMPADDKPSARYIVASITNDILKQYDFKYPVLDQKAMGNLKIYRKQLHKD